MAKKNWAFNFVKKRIETKSSTPSKPKAINKKNAKSSSKGSSKKKNKSNKKQTNIAVYAANKAGIKSKKKSKSTSGKSSKKKAKTKKTGGHRVKKRVNSASIVCINLNNGKSKNKRSMGNTKKKTNTKKSKMTKTEKNQRASSSSMLSYLNSKNGTATNASSKQNNKTRRSMGKSKNKKNTNSSFVKRTAASATTFVGSVGASALNNIQSIKNFVVTDHKANNARDKWAYGGSGSARRADWDIRYDQLKKSKNQLAKEKKQMEKQEKKDQKEVEKYIRNQKQLGNVITGSKIYRNSSSNSPSWVKSAGKFVADLPLYINPATAGAMSYQTNLEKGIRSGASYFSASNTAAKEGVKTGAITFALEGAARPVVSAGGKVVSAISKTKAGQRLAGSVGRMTSKLRGNRPSGYRNGEPFYDVKYREVGPKRTTPTQTSGEYGYKNEIVSINNSARGYTTPNKSSASGYRNGKPFYDVEYREVSSNPSPKLGKNTYSKGDVHSSNKPAGNGKNASSPNLGKNTYSMSDVHSSSKPAGNGKNASSPNLGKNTYSMSDVHSSSKPAGNGKNVSSPGLGKNTYSADDITRIKKTNEPTALQKVENRQLQNVTQSQRGNRNTNEIINVSKDYKIPTLDDVLKYRKVPNVNTGRVRDIKGILRKVGIGAGILTSAGTVYTLLNKRNNQMYQESVSTGARPFLSTESLLDYLFGSYSDVYDNLGSQNNYSGGSSRNSSYNGSSYSKNSYSSRTYNNITNINRVNTGSGYSGLGKYNKKGASTHYYRNNSIPDGLGSADANDLISQIMDFIEQNIIGNKQNLLAIINDYIKNGNINESLSMILGENSEMMQFINEILMRSLNEISVNGIQINDAFLEKLTNQIRNNYAMLTI